MSRYILPSPPKNKYPTPCIGLMHQIYGQVKIEILLASGQLTKGFHLDARNIFTLVSLILQVYTTVVHSV